MQFILRHIVLILVMLSFSYGQTPETQGIDSSGVRRPGRALLFSTIPGGGQLYNKRPLKALLFAGVFSYYTFEYLRTDNQYRNDLSNQTLHRERNDKIWMMGLIWTINILDAYVEAQLWDFEDYNIDETNLPEPEIIKPKEMEIIDDTE